MSEQIHVRQAGTDGQTAPAVFVMQPNSGGLRSHNTIWVRLWRSLKKNQLGLAGLVILILVVCGATLGVSLMPHDPLEVNLANRLLPPFWVAGGTADHLLGTDQLGRDMLTRILHGGRISLMVGLLSVAIAAPVGVCLGLLAGYFGNNVDAVLMRLADSQLAIPVEILAIAIIAVLGNSTPNVILVIALVNWVVYARVVRAEVLSLREKEFVEAARAVGVGSGRILFLHILPNLLTPVIVIASYSVALAMVLEAGLSFIGMGVPPPVPSWGRILQEGVAFLTNAWWVGFFPGAALAVTTAGINFIGDWLRDSFDPHLQV